MVLGVFAHRILSLVYTKPISPVGTEAEGAKQVQEAEFKLKSLDISESSCHSIMVLSKGVNTACVDE